MYTSSESGIYIRFYQTQITSLSGGYILLLPHILTPGRACNPKLICRIILEENAVDYQNVAGCISIMCSCNVATKVDLLSSGVIFVVYASVLGKVIKLASCEGHGLKSIGF